MKRRTARSMTIATGLVIAAVTFCGVSRLPVLAGAEPSGESLDLQYAQAYLNLAKAELAIFENANKAVPGSISEDEVKMSREIVQVFQKQVEEVKQGKKFDRMQELVQLASHRIQRAQSDLKRAEYVNRQVPGTFGADRIEKIKASEELAKLDYEAGKAALSASAAEQLLWRVSILEDEVMRLRDEVGKVDSQRR